MPPSADAPSQSSPVGSEVAPPRPLAGPPAWLFCLLVLLPAALIVFRVVATGHGLGGAGDLELMYRPYWRYLGESLRAGRLPLWDPDMGIGIPFAASPQSQALYPPAMLVFALLPMELAVLVFCLGHLLLLAVGVQRLARRMGWDASVSLCAAALMASAPLVFSSIVRPNVLCAEAWLPWTLLAALRVCDRGSGLRWLSLCVALGLLSASPEITLLAVLAVGVLAIARERGGQRGAIAWCLLGGLLGVGLAAVGLVPFLELLRHSTREGEIAGMQTAWSVRSGDLGSLVLPFLKNGAAAKTFQDFLFGPFQFDFYTLYFGIAAVVLGGVAAARASRWSRLLWGVVALSILLGMFGGYLGIGLQKIGLLPFGWRYPVKFLFPASVALALVGAAGAAELATGRHPRLQRGLAVGGGLLVAGGILVVSWLGPTAAVSLAWDGCCLLLLAAILQWAPAGGWRLWALTLACVLDVALTCIPFQLTSVLDRCPALVAAAKARAGGGRVDALCVDWPDASQAKFEPESGLAQCLSGNVMAEHGLPAARYYGTPAPMGSAEAMADDVGATGEALLGVTLVLRGHAEPMAGVVPLQAPELAPIWAATVPEVASRVELRRTERVVPDAMAALGKETPTQAREEVLLEAPPPDASPAGEPYDGEDFAKLGADGTPERLEIETASRGERYLVLADRFYPGWTASVDGSPLEVLRAYGLLRALRLGPGRHRVAFQFHPPSFRRGLAVTLASALLLLAVGAVRRL